MHHLSSSPAISGRTFSFESSYITFGSTSISAGGPWETRPLSSAESSALLIPFHVDAGPPLAALMTPLKYRIIPDAIKSTRTAIPTPIPALEPVEIPANEPRVVPLPSLAPVGSEPEVLLPAVLAGLRLAGAAVVVFGLDVDFVDALLNKLKTVVSVASQAAVTPMLRTIEILVYANMSRGV